MRLIKAAFYDCYGLDSAPRDVFMNTGSRIFTNAALRRIPPFRSFDIIPHPRISRIRSENTPRRNARPTLRETLHALAITRLFFYRYVIRNGILNCAHASVKVSFIRRLSRSPGKPQSRIIEGNCLIVNDNVKVRQHRKLDARELRHEPLLSYHLWTVHYVSRFLMLKYKFCATRATLR